MPVDRNGRVPNTNGHSQIHWPDAYRHVLEKKCSRDAPFVAQEYLAAPDPLSDTEVDVQAWERGVAECKARLLEERAGEPVRVQSWMLPDGLPPPFENWPRGGAGRRSFVVEPDDTITLRQFETTSEREGLWRNGTQHGQT